MSFIEVDPGVNLFYEIQGKGKTILFVHGWTMDHAVWQYQISELANHFQTVVLDLRGSGDSDKPWGDYSYDVYARDIATVIQKLCLTDITLVGWSLGGAIGALYLSKYGDGVSKFISVDGVIPNFVQTASTSYGQPKEKVNAWILEEKTRRPDFTKEFVDSMFFSDVGMYTKLWIWTICMKTSWHAAISSLETLRDTDMLNILPTIKVPTAVFHGVHDHIVPFELAKLTTVQIPGAKLVSFADSGHVPFIEEHDKFNRELTQFIDPSKRTFARTRWSIR